PHLRGDVGRGEILRGGASGVEDFEQPEDVMWTEHVRDRLDQLLANETGRPESMRLEHRQHSGSAELGSPERRFDLVRIVREVIDHLDARDSAVRLEPTGDALEPSERVRALAQRNARL